MAVAITQTANPAGAATTANVATYSGLAIGTASPDRIIVVTVGAEQASATINFATIDGVTMFDLAGSTITTFVAMRTAVFYLPWPTGTTAEIKILFGAAALGTENHITVYAVTDADGAPQQAVTATSTDMDATAPLTTGNFTIPTGGAVLMVAVGATDTVAKTWGNATVDVEADAGLFRYTTATRLTAGTVSVTCQGSTNLEDGALSGLVFRPQVIPTLVMAPPRL